MHEYLTAHLLIIDWLLLSDIRGIICVQLAYIHQQVRAYMWGGLWWGGVREADLCACVRLYCAHVHLASDCQTAIGSECNYMHTSLASCVHVKAHMIYCDDYNLYRNINILDGN